MIVKSNKNPTALTASEIYILAGGGGAACLAHPNSWHGHGGAGGGIQGYAGTNYSTFNGGLGGAQSFTNNGQTPSTETADLPKMHGAYMQGGGGKRSCTGGGGGYYGGGASWGAAGGGGSGYIGNSKLSNKKMVGYYDSTKGLTSTSAAITDNATGTKTESTKNVSSSAISDYAKSGHGYVRITSL